MANSHSARIPEILVSAAVSLPSVYHVWTWCTNEFSHVLCWRRGSPLGWTYGHLNKILVPKNKFFFFRATQVQPQATLVLPTTPIPQQGGNIPHTLLLVGPSPPCRPTTRACYSSSMVLEVGTDSLPLLMGHPLVLLVALQVERVLLLIW